MITLTLVCLATGLVFASGFFLARWLDRGFDDFKRLPSADDMHETPRENPHARRRK